MCAGCEVTISGCMMLAELHIAYASQISEKLKGRLRSSGKAMQAEFRESQTHTQVIIFGFVLNSGHPYQKLGHLRRW